MVVEQEPAEFLSRPEDLATPVALPPFVRRGEIEQSEGTVERVVQAALVSRFPSANAPLDFAADVRHLLDQPQASPPRRQIGVNVRRRGHASLTRAATTRRMTSRRAGFSTSRLRFPCDGRTLIIE